MTLQPTEEARERADSGELTSDELKALERALAEDMPDSALAQLAPEHRPPTLVAETDNEFRIAQAIP